MTHPERAQRRAAMTADLAAGMSIEKVRKRYRVGLAIVYRMRLAALGRPPKAPSRLDDPAIDWNQTNSAIARFAGVSRERVRQVRNSRKNS
jgi:transposase